MRAALYRAAGAFAGVVLLVWRGTCSYRTVDDPRPRMRREGRRYVIALRHAHQLAAILGTDEPRIAAMVSRSAEGDLLVPSLRMRGVEAVRGSSRTRAVDKGGLAALELLAGRVQEGTVALIAVDGPRGPRGRVHSGVAQLVRRCGAVVVPLIIVPSRRFTLGSTWDRFQIPLPFARLTGYFGESIAVAENESNRGAAARIGAALDALEERFDPAEWREAADAARQRRAVAS